MILFKLANLSMGIHSNFLLASIFCHSFFLVAIRFLIERHLRNIFVASGTGGYRYTVCLLFNILKYLTLTIQTLFRTAIEVWQRVMIIICIGSFIRVCLIQHLWVLITKPLSRRPHLGPCLCRISRFSVILFGDIICGFLSFE